MKIEIQISKEVNVATIELELPVRYEQEDIPSDFPLRKGDMWRARVNIDTGAIQNWPAGRAGDLHMKVVDCGTYTLYDDDGQYLAAIEGDYVPNGVVPGSCGDYVELTIDANGIITNWPKQPDVSAFFPRD